MENFAAYKKQIINAKDFTEGTTKLLQDLHNDNLFTADQRAKTLALVEAVFEPTNKKRGVFQNQRLNTLDASLFDFVHAIIFHLSTVDEEFRGLARDELLFSHRASIQRWRNTFAKELMEILKTPKISDDARRKVAVFHLETTVSEMQSSYYRVTMIYFDIRQGLLKALYY